MKKKLIWLNTCTSIAIIVWTIDMNVTWYHHPANNIPVLKYSLIALSAALAILLICALYRNAKK